MAELIFITADDARRKAESKEALLVCAYPEDEKFRKFHLAGAMSLKTFEAGLATIPKNQEIIFYCA